MKKRILSAFMALLMLFALMPAGVFAAPEPVSTTVDITSQYGGAFLHAPAFDVTVTSDLAENYGFTDSVADGVSVLDVLVKAHELTFGESFTKATAGDYLAISQYGSPSKQFGISSSDAYGGFFLNHALANDGTKYDANNYNGTTVTTQKAAPGDLIEFFFYEDPNYGDSYNWFTDGNGNYSRSFSAFTGAEISLTLKSFYAMNCSLFKDESEMISSDKPIDTEDAQIYSVDLKTGALTAISGAVTDEDGVVKLKFDEAGTYTVAAGTGDAAFTQILSLSTVSVKAPAVPAAIKVDPQYKRLVKDNQALAETGDTFTVCAFDAEGNDVSGDVKWSTTSGSLGTIDEDSGKITVTGSVFAGSTSYFYAKATSKGDPSKSYQTSIQLIGYKMSASAKDQKVALSADGQTAKTGSIGAAGYAGLNAWQWTVPEGCAEVREDPETANRIYFNLYRPCVIEATVTVNLDEGMTDSGKITVTGVAVEDTEGTRGKVYLGLKNGGDAPTVQLKAYLEEGKTLSSWSTADENVATVDESGLVTAKGVGSVIITATDDAGTKGGIKVVVESLDTPYFESLEFLTSAFASGAWVSGQTFSATKTEYDLPIKAYSTSQLTLQATTLYDTEKYDAVAEYTDISGNAQKVSVNSGKITYLKDIPFDASTVTVTISSKTDETNKTVYTFNVTRPRDTTKTLKANTGLALAPEGRSLLATKYKDQAEGVFFRADENGDLATGTGVSGTV